MYWVIKAILKPLLKVIYRIRIEGLENLPKKGPAIIAANHLSFLDSFFIPLSVHERKVTYLAKADYFKSWKTSWFFKMVGQIPTEREGGAKSKQVAGHRHSAFCRRASCWASTPRARGRRMDTCTGVEPELPGSR